MSRASDIAEIAGHVKKADRVCFITGAGASKSAGVPLAGELISEINSEYGHCLNDLAEPERRDYGKVMSRLSRGDRVKLLGKYLEGCPISWGQIALATIVKWAIREDKKVVRVLTFNFDLVLENAASLLGLHLPVYDFASAPSGNTGRIAPHAILHLHGQSYGFVLLNSEGETADHRKLLKPVLRDTVCEGVTIVTGYSGEADGAFTVIRDEYDGFNWLVWLGYDQAAKGHLAPLSKNGCFKYVGGCDFDQTMIALAKELGIWPPTIISNPMQHLLDQLTAVAKYPVEHDSGTDVLESTRDRLARFSERWAADHGVRDKAAALVIGGNAGTESVEALAQEEELAEDARSNLAWAAVVEGNTLSGEALTLAGPAAADRFAASYAKYAQALAIKPDMHEALNNWGVALAEEAKTLAGPAAAERFAASYDKYERALAIKPDKHEALNNWGSTLADEARMLAGSAAAERYAASYDKYERALAIKPDMHEALNNWGNTLADEARMLAGPAAAERFAASYDKYERALAIKPDKHEALNNWGVALADEAKTLAGPAAAERFAASYDKYERALAIKPDKHEALNNWGNTLSDEARTLAGPAAAERFAASYDKYAQALAIKPDKHEALNNWGVALADEAKTLAGPAAAERFAASYDKYERALAIKPDKHEALNNWSIALSDEVKTLPTAEAHGSVAEAEQRFLAARGPSGEKGTYNLACLYALTGRPEEAMAELAACRDDGQLPDRAHLEGDSDLDALRDRPDFQALLDGLDKLLEPASAS